MSVTEMKIEVINKITNLNNEALLKEVFALLNDSGEIHKRAINISETYEVIKEQYGDVLQKLAQ